MSMLIVQLAVFLCVAATIGAVALIMNRATDPAVEDRLAMLTGSTAARQAKETLKATVLNQPLDSGQGWLAVYMSRLQNFTLLFEQADTSLTPSQFVAISAGIGVVGMIVPLVIGLHPTIVVPTGLMLASLPLVWLLLRRRSRLRKFAKQLPDALELISRALRAGHSLGSGFNLVAEEMRPPISKEFQRAFEEQNLGVALDAALENLTQRIPNLDLRFFATAVVLQRQTGGDLAEILDKIGYLVRERFKIWGTVQALTGEGRLSGIVLLALPPMLFLAVYKLNPEYVMPLFTDPMGRKMLVGAIVMQLLGAIVIKKIITIKV